MKKIATFMAGIIGAALTTIRKPLIIKNQKSRTKYVVGNARRWRKVKHNLEFKSQSRHKANKKRT